jgi:hypothetical protein
VGGPKNIGGLQDQSKRQSAAISQGFVQAFAVRS